MTLVSGTRDFVLICATALHFSAIWDILDIVESITYVFSIGPYVGAPGLDSETWENTNPGRLPHPRDVVVLVARVG
jgi:hypothetical protein